MDKPISGRQAIELIMVANGDAMILPSGHVVIRHGLAFAIGQRAICLPTRPLRAKEMAIAALATKQKALRIAAKRLTELVVSGQVKTKGSRVCGGWREDVAAYEYEGLVIDGDNGVNVITGAPKIFDIVVDGAALVRQLRKMFAAADPPSSANGKTEPLATLQDVKEAVAKHGGDTQEKSWEAARTGCHGRKVTRRLLIQAIEELWGRPGKTGRPKKEISRRRI